MKFAPGTRDSITGKPYFYFSECGRFYVTIPTDETEPYMAYRKREPDERLPAEYLGRFDTSKAAKAACEARAG